MNRLYMLKIKLNVIVDKDIHTLKNDGKQTNKNYVERHKSSNSLNYLDKELRRLPPPNIKASYTATAVLAEE